MLTDFGRFLRKLRIDRGELIKDMAEKLGVTASYLSAVETGKRNIPDAWVREISNGYHLDESSRQALSAAAARSAKTIKLELANMPGDKRETAILFAREFSGMDDLLYFPVMPFLERVMPLLFEGFYYEVVPIEEFSSNKHADTDVANRCIRIREDIYYRAAADHGRDRMTVMHEAAHYILLVVCGVKFGRAFGDEPIETYMDPEWQAKALAGELMCPAHLIEKLSADQIARECGVSLQAAELNLSKCERSGACWVR